MGFEETFHRAGKISLPAVLDFSGFVFYLILFTLRMLLLFSLIRVFMCAQTSAQLSPATSSKCTHVASLLFCPFLLFWWMFGEKKRKKKKKKKKRLCFCDDGSHPCLTRSACCHLCRCDCWCLLWQCHSDLLGHDWCRWILGGSHGHCQLGHTPVDAICHVAGVWRLWRCVHLATHHIDFGHEGRSQHRCAGTSWRHGGVFVPVGRCSLCSSTLLLLAWWIAQLCALRHLPPQLCQHFLW